METEFIVCTYTHGSLKKNKKKTYTNIPHYVFLFSCLFYTATLLRVERETGVAGIFFLLNLNLHTGPRKPGFWLSP